MAEIKTRAKKQLVSNTITVNQQHTSDTHLILDERKRQEWFKDYQFLSRIVPDNKPYDFLISKLSKESSLVFLSDEILERLWQVKQPDKSPFIVLRNLPIDEKLPSAPTNGRRPETKKTWISEITLLKIAKTLKLQPFAYKQEKEGTLIHEIAPKSGEENSLSNGGRIPLGFHTDHAILKRDYRPEFLMLLCLKNPSQIPTYIIELDKALKALRDLNPQYEMLLRQSHFRVETPESLPVWNGKVIQSEPRPLISKGLDGEDEVAGNLYAVKTKNPKARSALDAFISILPKIANEVVLQPGDLLIFNNCRCLHARAAVEGERWLQRLFCRRSLEQLRSATRTGDDCTIFDTKFLVLE